MHIRGCTMSTDTTAFDDVLDPRTDSQADHGVSASRKAELAAMDGPLQVLDQLGIDVPHKTFTPEDEHEFPTTLVADDNTRVSLFQDVRESFDDDSFGDMGLSEDEDDDVIWTVVDLSDGTVNLTVVGDWGKRREVPIEDFAANYEPITVETAQGTVPRLGY